MMELNSLINEMELIKNKMELSKKTNDEQIENILIKSRDFTWVALALCSN